MATHHGERMISANGIDICTDSFGDPDDPAILLIMGAGASMLLWEEPMCHRAADSGRFVVRYDNRDTGRTTSYPPGKPTYSIADMAADAIGVLDAYNIHRSHIIGASLGGMVTQMVGLEHPDRVLTLTIIMSTPDPLAVMDAIAGVETLHQLSPPEAAVLEDGMRTYSLDWADAEAVLEARVASFRTLAGSAHEYDEAGRRKLFAAEIERAISFQSIGNHGAVIATSDRWHDRLGEIEVPTLIVHGTEDPLFPFDHGEALAASITGARLHAMRGVGHEVPDGELDTLLPLLLEHTRANHAEG